MPSLGDLPPELVHKVFVDGDILGLKDLAALALTSRWLHTLANPSLYRLEARDPKSYVFYAAAESGHTGRLQKFIGVGFDVNQYWFSEYSGARLADLLIRKRWEERVISTDQALIAQYEADVRWHTSHKRFRYRHITEDDDKMRENLSDSQNSDFLGSSKGSIDDDVSRFWTALHLAATNGQDETVQFLIDQGANIDAPSRRLCCCTQVIACLAISMTYPFDDHEYDPMWSPLHIAICQGHVSTAKLLLRRGASIVVDLSVFKFEEFQMRIQISGLDYVPAEEVTARLDPHNRCTALHAACYYNMYSLVKFLMEDGYQSNVDAKDRFGQTPFAYAFCAGNLAQIGPYLRSKGCDIDIFLGGPFGGGAFGRGSRCVGTPLMMACRAVRFDHAISLVELGAGVNCIDLRTGRTPLHTCTLSPYLLMPTIRSRWQEIQEPWKNLIHKLLEAGACTTVVKEYGTTLREWFVNVGDIRMLRLLKTFGVDADIEL